MSRPRFGTRGRGQKRDRASLHRDSQEPNGIVDTADNYLVKRFYNIDHNTYLEGIIPAKYKELMGLVVSAGPALR